MVLALDGTTPAKFTGTTLAITSASFTPPAGALLLLAYTNNSAASVDESVASVTNTGTAATWTRRARKNRNASSTGGQSTVSGGAEFWTAVAPGGAITVTATGVGTGAGHEKMGKVFVLTGADTATLTNVGGAHSSSGLPSITLTGCAIGSYVFACSSDWSQKGLGTAGTAQTIVDESDTAGQVTLHTWRTTATLAAAGSQIMNLTAPAAEEFDQVAIEVKASGAAPSVAPFRPMLVRQAVNRAGSY